MAVAFRSKDQGGGAAGTSTVASAPAGLANDDILIYWVYKENTAAITWPSGFSEVGSIAASNSSFKLYVAWKRAASESGTYTASWTGSAWRNYGLEAYSGCVTSGSPMDATPTTQANGSSSSDTCPSITTATANAMLACGAANFDGSFATGYPSGMNGRITQDGDLGIADLIIASPGATGTKVFSLSVASQNVGISLALTPAGSFNPTQTVTDTGAGADSASPQTQTTIAESGSGSDAAVAQTQAAIADTGSGADAISSAVRLATIAESGSGVDTPGGALASSQADTGAGADASTGQIQALIGDSGAGSDTPAVAYQFSIADSGSGADAESSQAQASISETGSGADAASADGQDTASVGDSGGGADASSGGYAATLTESATGADSPAGVLAASLSDSGSGADALTSQAQASGAEAGSGADLTSGLIQITVADLASGADAAYTGSSIGPGHVQAARSRARTLAPARQRLWGVPTRQRTYAESTP